MNNHEAKLQEACVRYFRYQYPKLKDLYFAIPNGGSRHKLEAANLKRQGVLAGVPDTFLALAKGKYHGLWIEFKHGKNRLTSNQINVLSALIDEGYKTAVVYTFDEFVQTINIYLEDENMVS